MAHYNTYRRAPLSNEQDAEASAESAKQSADKEAQDAETLKDQASQECISSSPAMVDVTLPVGFPIKFRPPYLELHGVSRWPRTSAKNCKISPPQSFMSISLDGHNLSLETLYIDATILLKARR